MTTTGTTTPGRSGKLRILTRGGPLICVVALALAGCAQPPFGTPAQQAPGQAMPRPAADQRGVISFPSFQLVVAKLGDTASSIGQRLGIDGKKLASHNAVDADAPLGQGAVLTLPGGPRGSVQVTDPFAGQGVRPYGAPPAGQARTDTGAAPASTSTGTEPRQHRVVSGETAWSISRKYGVTVADLASWNGLPDNMTIRMGQILTIPASGTPAAAPSVTVPGSGSPTPKPPSAATALPTEDARPASADRTASAAPAPDLGATRTAASSGGRLAMPASGVIARAYKKGVNDGIDIRAEPGSPVKAAAGGTVAAITRDTQGIPIVVIRHQGDLMTVYAGLDQLSVAKGDTVSAGQAIGNTRPGGMLHFEVRQGFESVDPAGYL